MKKAPVTTLLVIILIILVGLGIGSRFYTTEKHEARKQELGTSSAPVTGWKKYTNSILTYYYPPYLTNKKGDLYDDKGNLIQFIIEPSQSSIDTTLSESIQGGETDSRDRPTTLIVGDKKFRRYYATNADFFTIFLEDYRLDVAVVFNSLEYPENDLPREDIFKILGSVEIN